MESLKCHCFITEPPLVILEFVPHGDLLGFLKRSRGETDDYYDLKRKEIPRKISIQQLYKFASDIARGMEFISAHQVHVSTDITYTNVYSPSRVCLLLKQKLNAVMIFILLIWYVFARAPIIKRKMIGALLRGQ